MIENFLTYTDLLAILLGLAFSGLLIFCLYLLGAHGDHDGDAHHDHGFGHDFDHDVDHDIGHGLDHDFDHDHGFGHDFDHDVDHDIGYGLDHDFDHDHGFGHDIDHDISHGLDHDHGFGHDVDHSVEGMASSIEVDGGSSLLAQIGAFCLTVGLFGFFTVLSIGKPEGPVNRITSLDITILILLAMGAGMYVASNRILRAMTKGAVNQIQEVRPGLAVTVISDYIDFGKQGRVHVHVAGGEKIMMAKGHGPKDFLVRGENGIVVETGIPLKVSQIAKKGEKKDNSEKKEETTGVMIE